MNVMQNPGYWRERAEETRAKADSFRYGATRKTLLKVAEEYDRLALRAETMASAATGAESGQAE